MDLRLEMDHRQPGGLIVGDALLPRSQPTACRVQQQLLYFLVVDLQVAPSLTESHH